MKNHSDSHQHLIWLSWKATLIGIRLSNGQYVVERQTLLQLLQVIDKSSEGGADVALCFWQCLFSSHSSMCYWSLLCTPALTVCLQLLQTAAVTSHVIGLMSLAFCVMCTHLSCLTCILTHAVFQVARVAFHSDYKWTLSPPIHQLMLFPCIAQAVKSRCLRWVAANIVWSSCFSQDWILVVT